jgi:hypothetical protein
MQINNPETNLFWRTESGSIIYTATGSISNWDMSAVNEKAVNLSSYVEANTLRIVSIVAYTDLGIPVCVPFFNPTTGVLLVWGDNLADGILTVKCLTTDAYIIANFGAGDTKRIDAFVAYNI